jgi:hypothetical protein
LKLRRPQGRIEWFLIALCIAAVIVTGIQIYLLYRIHELGGSCYYTGLAGKGGMLICKPR